jgi:hypothetical protein
MGIWTPDFGSGESAAQVARSPLLASLQHGQEISLPVARSQRGNHLPA